MIRAPFNFVPLANKVYFPDWAKNISMDIPFEDGLSGCINVKITAETPIFVRNGHGRNDGELPASQKTDAFKSFCKTPDERYFIPASSVKGTVRSVLEILSFSKMNRIDNKRYSIRDLSSASNKYMKFFQNNEVHCGWMKKDGDKLIITDNGVPGRLSMLDFYLKTDVDIISKISDKEFLRTDSNRTAKCKYELAGNACLDGKFIKMPFNSNNPVDKRVKVKYDENGERGHIVFTGQPSARQCKKDFKTGKEKWQGKFYEFVFFENVNSTFEINNYEDDELYNDFCFIYKDSEDWKYWKNKLENGQSVPVFMTSQGDKLLSFGLSYLYKLPFPKKVKGYIYDQHLQKDLDLSECIFGSSELNLKGRVQFSNAFCVKGNVDKEISPYMGSPKPTFYPIYIKQNGTFGVMEKDSKGVFFKTMLDENAKIRGWKRYPVRKNVDAYETPEGQSENTNPSIPLSAGSEFLLKIRFHNLKHVELGALLQAIELKEGCSHSIGFAKALGYGSCKFDIESIETDYNDKTALIREFSDLMSDEIEDYTKSPQLRELFAMMRKENAEKLNIPLEYMEELTDFVNVKKQNFKKAVPVYGEYQQNYTELIKRESPQAIAVPKKAIAIVTVFGGGMKLAKLENDRDQSSKTLNVPITNKTKIKIGDRIEVETELNAKGKIKSLLFIKKIL